MNSLSLPEVTVAPYINDADGRVDPERCLVFWRCFDCGHCHQWVWPEYDACSDRPVSMQCDHCGEKQRMLFPGHLHPEIQLAHHVAARDTDPTEALIEPERPVFPREWPEELLREWPQADAAGPRDAAEPHETDSQADTLRQRARLPVIQDGQRLARELHTYARLIRDGDWTLLKMQASEVATVLSESGNTLREFGA